MNSIHLSTIDYSIIGLYALIVLIIGIYVTYNTKDSDDLFLAGRSLGFFSIGFSLFASNISSTTLIGLSGAAYSSGIAVSNYEWMAGVILIFMSFFYIPIYLNSKITTIPEFLKKRFGGSSNKYFSAITIFLSIVVDTAGGLYAGSIVLITFFPDLNLFYTCFSLAVATGLYTAAGGLKAVVYTDVIQSFVLIFGCAIMTYILFGHYDYSWETLSSSLPNGHLSLIKPLDDEQLPWLGTLIGVPILGFWYWATNQYITQRILGAKSISHARWGASLGGLLKLLPLFIMVLPGVMAVKLFPNLANPDMVFPTLVSKVLPAGLTGLVLSGLIAAIMSSIDSTLNSASTLILHDFVLAKNPNMDSKKVAWYGRVTTVILMLIAAFWAPMIANFSGLFAYLQKSFSVLVPPVATIFLLGVFTTRGSAKTSLSTLICGHLLGIILFLCSEAKIMEIHFTIIAGLTTFFCIGMFFIFSILFNEKSVTSDFVIKKENIHPIKNYPWYLDYRYQSGFILGLVIIMLIKFW